MNFKKDIFVSFASGHFMLYLFKFSGVIYALAAWIWVESRGGLLLAHSFFLAHIFLLQPHHEGQVLLYAHFEAGAALFMSRRRFKTEIQVLVFKTAQKRAACIYHKNRAAPPIYVDCS